MQFKAIKKGYFDDSIVNPGESFEAPDDFSASWAVKAEAYKPEPEESDEVKIERAREGLQGSKKKKKKAGKKKVSKKVSKKVAGKE
jgi:hypothetical protein